MERRILTSGSGLYRPPGPSRTPWGGKKIRRATGPGRVRTSAPVSSPCSLFPSGTGLQSWSPGDTIYGVLGEGDGARNPPRQPVDPPLGKAQKIIPKLVSFWIDFGSQHGSNLAPKICQNRFKIDAKIPSYVDLIFLWIFDRFLLPTWIPRIRQIMVFPKGKLSFFKKSFSQVNVDLGSFLMPTWLHFPSKNPPKSVKKLILKGIIFLIVFCIDF